MVVYISRVQRFLGKPTILTAPLRSRLAVMITLSRIWLAGVALFFGVAVLCSSGCSKIQKPRGSSPGPTYTGPAFLHGTIGSLARVRGYEPLLVGGYGLVVNLNGTGSSEVPGFLRQWLINEMRKRGVGSAAIQGGIPSAGITPAQMLASRNTAVVAVQGLIPPGATKGSRFDVLMSSLPQTQTTSLEGGRLWTVDLSVGGAGSSTRFGHKLAEASGPAYINPLDRQTPQERSLQLRRQAVALSGGMATTSRKMELVLNQPSWQRSRLIADRINERFPKAPSDRRNTAVAVDDSYIRLNVPRRYRERSDELLELITHLFVQRGAGFEQTKAQQLADLLVAEPRYALRITRAWVAMGKTVLPVVRRYYSHDRMEVRLAVLEAGARLEDEKVVEQLIQIAGQSDVDLRQRVGELLVFLPRSLRGARMLYLLLDDRDLDVRLAAYESLAFINDPVINRQVIDGPEPDRFKFVLDVVPAKAPLVYVAQRHAPRVVVFGPALGFRSPFLAKLWDNRLMLRSADLSGPVNVFYQRPGQAEGRTFVVPARLSELVYLLAHKPTIRSPLDGLDLSYGQVVGVVHRLCKEGAIPSEIHFQINPIASAIAQAQADESQGARPETGAVTPGDNPQGVSGEGVGGRVGSP